MTDYQKPVCRLVVNGQDITEAVVKRLISISLTEQRNLESSELSIELSDHDGRLEIPPHNAQILLWLGWDKEGVSFMGAYTVDETEHRGAPDTVSIRARSADWQDSIKVKREGSWEETTLGEVLVEVAGRNGLGCMVDGDLAGEPIKRLDQANESDAHLIQRLALQFDAATPIKENVLDCYRNSNPRGHVSLSRKSGDSHSYLRADRNRYDGVKAYYYPPNSARRSSITAGGEPLKELRNTYQDKEAALAAAESELARLKRGEATLSYSLARGQPGLKPENTYSLTGIKAEIDAIIWVGKSVTHNLADGGYTTRLELEVHN